VPTKEGKGVGTGGSNARRGINSHRALRSRIFGACEVYFQPSDIDFFPSLLKVEKRERRDTQPSLRNGENRVANSGITTVVRRDTLVQIVRDVLCLRLRSVL
jgi:hypothetical protein